MVKNSATEVQVELITVTGWKDAKAMVTAGY